MYVCERIHQGPTRSIKHTHRKMDRGACKGYYFQCRNMDGSWPTVEVHTGLINAAIRVPNTLHAMWRIMRGEEPFIFLRLKEQRAMAGHQIKVLSQCSGLSFTTPTVMKAADIDALVDACQQSSPDIAFGPASNNQDRPSSLLPAITHPSLGLAHPSSSTKVKHNALPGSFSI
jgi:hypothetical protein